MSGQRIVLHLVFDSEQADVQDQARLDVDGARQASTSDAVALGKTVDMLDPTHELCVSNRPVSDVARSFEGSLYYAAAYDTALTPSEIETNVEVLLADDDTPVTQ